MFRGILLAILIAIAIRLVLGILRAVTSAATPKSASNSSPQGGELRKDPICGTFVAASVALQKKSGGETYYFCSDTCRDKFRA